MKSTKIQALGNYVVIKPLPLKNVKSRSSADITEAHEGDVRWAEATVIASALPELKKGDVVVYDRVAGYNHIFEDGVFRILRAGDIAGVASDE